MCGIAGIVRIDAPLTDVDRASVLAMTQALAHRGPDSEGTYFDSQIGFGFRRLAILDPTARANQPMRTPGDKGVLIYNGEVYNHLELREELQREGVQFNTGSDTETVLHCLERWGPHRAVERFNGMFAFAYFDTRNRKLWLSRDRLGIKPLSIRFGRQRIIFASEDKAILKADGVTAEFDTDTLNMRMQYITDGNNHSLLQGVERVQPGTLLEISEEGVKPHVFWNSLRAFDPHRWQVEGQHDDQRIEAVDQLLKSSVEAHLASDMPVAISLSGGVDSGIVSSIARSVMGKLDAYVVDPHDGPNERAAATRTAEKSGTRIRPVDLSPEAYLRAWPETVLALETSSYSRQGPAKLIVARQARSDGYPVLLMGEGADEIFGGYPRYLETDFIFWKFRNRRSFLQKYLAQRSKLATSPRFKSAIAGVQQLINHKAAQIDLINERFKFIKDDLQRAFVCAQHYDYLTHLQELLVVHDRTGMAASVEIRVPFIENNIINYGLHLPFNFRYRDKTFKYLLKRVAERHIPRENIYKRKLGYEVGETFTEGTQDLLRGGLLRHYFGLNQAGVEETIDQLTGDPGLRSRLLGIELYLRLFIDRQDPAELGEKLVAMHSDWVLKNEVAVQ